MNAAIRIAVLVLLAAGCTRGVASELELSDSCYVGAPDAILSIVAQASDDVGDGVTDVHVKWFVVPRDPFEIVEADESTKNQPIEGVSARGVAVLRIRARSETSTARGAIVVVADHNGTLLDDEAEIIFAEEADCATSVDAGVTDASIDAGIPDASIDAQ